MAFKATEVSDIGERPWSRGEASFLDSALQDSLVRASFKKCVDIVIGLEGGDKIVADSGGVTRWGISARAHPGVDIINLTRDEAVALYRDEYWDECLCDGLPWPMDLVVFDAAVNQGVTYAKNLTSSSVDYVEALLLRVERYSEIAERDETKRQYLRGWVNRVVKLFRMIQA